jgi:hypothetical protein
MTLEEDIAAAERTEAARHLIDQAQDHMVELVIVSAVDLCVLGGPKHPLFEESVARAWSRLGNRGRKDFIERATEVMVKRGLLIDTSPRTGSGQLSGTYSLKPELGLMLAARCRPSFIVVTEAEGQNLRALRLFALGDQAEPVRGLVAEVPTGLPPDKDPDSPFVRKLGPLGRVYRYALLSRDTAAELLAKWTISPPRRSGEVPSCAYLVSVYHPDRQNPAGYRLRVRSDGMRALLDSPGIGDGDLAAAEYDVEGLRAVMLDLITRPSR